MPEFGEIIANSAIINSLSHKIFGCVYNLNGHKQLSLSNGHGPFSLSSETRGKELKLNINYLSTSRNYSILFNLGMSGMWFVSPVHPDDLIPLYKNNTLLAFEPINNDNEWLCFSDVRRFAKWRDVPAGVWGKSRGPDPIKERDTFISNINSSINSKDFKKPVYEVLMNQKYFNGIGNILRADLLSLIDDTPFQSAESWFSKHPDFTELIADHLGMTADRLSSYGPGSQYQRGNHIIDKNGRKFWYEEKFTL